MKVDETVGFGAASIVLELGSGGMESASGSTPPRLEVAASEGPIVCARRVTASTSPTRDGRVLALRASTWGPWVRLS